MRKLFFIILLLGSTISLSAQMTFETGSWAEVQAKAKKENKMIFIDVYTSWCGPCKVMAKDIFTLPQVGDFYNKNFINYKIDAEKGEGIAIAKKYQANSYPTYLFVDGDGKLFYRSGGSKPFSYFLKDGEVALAQFSDKKTIEEWDTDYTKKKNNLKFLKSYMAKRNLLKLDNADILDHYASLAKPEEMLTKEFLSQVLNGDGKVNAGGVFFNFLMDNLDKIPEVVGQSKDRILHNLPFWTTLYSVKKAASNNDEQFFAQILEGNKRLMAVNNDHLSELNLKSTFYGATKQGEKLASVAVPYSEALIGSIPELMKKDKESFDTYLQEISDDPSKLKGKTPEELDMTISFRKTNLVVGVAYKIRDLALNVSNLCSDRELKLKALCWAYHASILFDNFSNYEAIAEVHYQLGNYSEAKYWIERCIDTMPKLANDDIRNRVKAKENKIDSVIN